MTEQTDNQANRKFDILGDILETIRFRGTVFFHAKLAAPWGISFAPMKIPRFHIALSGECFIGTKDDQFLRLQQMEIAMIPTGNAHWVADQPNSKLVESESVGEACELNRPMFQKGEITNLLMCGLVQYDEDTPHPIFDTLPDVLHFSEELISESTWSTIKLIDGEIQRKKNNSSPIIDRLTEALFLQLLEAYVERNEQDIGFFAALGDPRLKQALALIHHNPETNWTVTSLGKEIGMSKATLNRHFQHTIGLTPIAYIKNWKMMKALNLAKYSSFSLEQVAEFVGFSSARTLNKAFLRHYGYTPSHARKSAR
ncbi:MAG: helix-turn-helix domain-containing protein [Gammaproteobacteria bacterium]|nr:helix-turn-helix domain-containing protein [Gammaproteobacteria bacterium]